MPSMSFKIARWLSSISPLRLMATICGRLEVGDFRRAEITYAQRVGSCDLPSQRLGQARPRQSDFRAAFLKCSAVSRAVPSALSCSCGCCRINSATLFSIRVMLSQMQSGNGFWQLGQSGIACAMAAPVAGSDGF